MSTPVFSDTRTTFGNTKTSTFTTFIHSPRPQETDFFTDPAGSNTRIFAEDPFRARFGHRLPRGLREEAKGMQWRTFLATYAPASDMRMQFTHIEKLRGAHQRYCAEITETINGHRVTRAREVIASGPVQACSNILGDLGRRVEIHSFHQFEIFEATVTFVYAGNNKDRHWAMGFGGTREQSACTAMTAAAEMIYG